MFTDNMITDILFDIEFDKYFFEEYHGIPLISLLSQEKPAEPPSPPTSSSKSKYGYISSSVSFSSDGRSFTDKSEPSYSYKFSLDDELNKLLETREPNFYDYLLYYMNKKNIGNEIELYKKAEVDRKVFSKIRSMRETNHRPSKPTAIKLCLALELSSKQTQEMLNTVGLGMSNASLVDRIIMFFIEHNVFDIFEIDDKIFDKTSQRYLIENL